MAITKVSRGLLSTGVSDSSDATAITITSDEKVGIGNTSPNNALTVGSTSVTTSIISVVGSSSGFPQIRFSDDSSESGQGRVFYNSANDAMGFSTAQTERMRLDNTGALLVGTTSQIVSTTEECIHIKNGDGAGQLFLDNTRSSGNQFMVQIYRLGTRVGSIQTSTSGTSYLETSDYRTKENVDYDFNALERVAQLKPARYNFIVEPDVTVDGFLAHEVSPVVPQAVSGEKDAVDEEGNPDLQGIDHSKLVPLLTKAIQEQQEQIEALQSEINTLKGE